VFWRDPIAAPGWAEVPGSPSAAARPGAPCASPAGPTITVRPRLAHTVEVVAVDNAAPNCVNANDPTLIGCVVFHRWITGSDGLKAQELPVR
jgi:hypothetical protein